jgi:hypothetical protein
MDLSGDFFTKHQRDLQEVTSLSHYKKNITYKEGLRVPEPKFNGENEDFLEFTFKFYCCLERRGIPHILKPFAFHNANPTNLIGELIDADTEIYNILGGCLKGPRTMKCFMEHAFLRSGHQVWKLLCEEFISDCNNTRRVLMTEIHRLMFDQRTERFSQFLDLAENLRSRVIEIQGECTPELLLDCVKAALMKHSFYRNFLMAQDDNITSTKKLRTKLRAIHAQIRQNEEKPSRERNSHSGFHKPDDRNKLSIVPAQKHGQKRDRDRDQRHDRSNSSGNRRRFRNSERAAMADDTVSDYNDYNHRIAALASTDKEDDDHGEEAHFVNPPSPQALDDDSPSDREYVYPTIIDTSEIKLHCNGATISATREPTTFNSSLADNATICVDSGATVSIYTTELCDNDWENFKSHVRVKISGVGPTTIYSEGMGDRMLYLKSGHSIVRYVNKGYGHKASTRGCTLE